MIPARHGMSMALTLTLPTVLLSSAFGSNGPATHPPERWDRPRLEVEIPLSLRSLTPESASGMVPVISTAVAAETTVAPTSNVDLASFIERSSTFAVAMVEVKTLWRKGRVSVDVKSLSGYDITDSKAAIGAGVIGTYILSAEWSLFGGVGDMWIAGTKLKSNSVGLVLGVSGPIDLLSIFGL